MDPHLCPENEYDNDQHNVSSSSPSLDEDGTDPSYLFDIDSSPVTAEREKHRNAFIEREEQHVRSVRRTLAVAILICAVVVSSSVYALARRSEHSSFMHEVCCCFILLQRCSYVSNENMHQNQFFQV